MKTMDPFPRRMPICTHVWKLTPRPWEPGEQLALVWLAAGKGLLGTGVPARGLLRPLGQHLPLSISLIQLLTLSAPGLVASPPASGLPLVCQPGLACLGPPLAGPLPVLVQLPASGPSFQPLISALAFPVCSLPQLHLPCSCEVLGSPGWGALLARPGASAMGSADTGARATGSPSSQPSTQGLGLTGRSWMVARPSWCTGGKLQPLPE